MQHWHNLKTCNGHQKVFDAETLKAIAAAKLWNIWVPKTHGGLELGLTEGLRTLQQLASIDGSLGWTVTLCSGLIISSGIYNRKQQQNSSILMM